MANNGVEFEEIFFFCFKVMACPQILSQNVSIPTGRSRTFVFRGNNLKVPKDVRF